MGARQIVVPIVLKVLQKALEREQALPSGEAAMARW